MPRLLACLSLSLACAAATAVAGSPNRTLMTSAPRVLSVSQTTNVDGTSEVRGFVGPVLNTSIGTTSIVGASDLTPVALSKLVRAPIFLPNVMPELLYDPVSAGRPEVLVSYAVSQGFLSADDNAPIKVVVVNPYAPGPTVVCSGGGSGGGSPPENGWGAGAASTGCYDSAACTDWEPDSLGQVVCVSHMEWPAYCTQWAQDLGKPICTASQAVASDEQLLEVTTKNLQTWGTQPAALRDLIAQRWLAEEEKRLVQHFNQPQSVSLHPGLPNGYPLGYYIGRGLVDYLKANGLASGTYRYQQLLKMPATGETWSLTFQLRALPNGSITYGDARAISMDAATRVLVMRYSSVRKDEDIPPQWTNASNPHSRVAGRLSWHVEENNVTIEVEQTATFSDGRFDPPAPVDESEGEPTRDDRWGVRCLLQGVASSPDCPPGTPDAQALMALKRAGSVLLIYDEPLEDKGIEIPAGVDANGQPAYDTAPSTTTSISSRELVMEIVTNPNPGPPACFKVVTYREAGTWTADLLDKQRRYVALRNDLAITERSLDEQLLQDTGSYSVAVVAGGKLANYTDPAIALTKATFSGASYSYLEDAIDKTGQLVPSTVRAPLTYTYVNTTGAPVTSPPECE